MFTYNELGSLSPNELYALLLKKFQYPNKVNKFDIDSSPIGFIGEQSVIFCPIYDRNTNRPCFPPSLETLYKLRTEDFEQLLRLFKYSPEKNYLIFPLGLPVPPGLSGHWITAIYIKENQTLKFLDSDHPGMDTKPFLHQFNTIFSKFDMICRTEEYIHQKTQGKDYTCGYWTLLNIICCDYFGIDQDSNVLVIPKNYNSGSIGTWATLKAVFHSAFYSKYKNIDECKLNIGDMLKLSGGSLIEAEINHSRKTKSSTAQRVPLQISKFPGTLINISSMPNRFFSNSPKKLFSFCAVATSTILYSTIEFESPQICASLSLVILGIILTLITCKIKLAFSKNNQSLNLTPQMS